jgi:phosphohistidine swiveling domain-containing protein
MVRKHQTSDAQLHIVVRAFTRPGMTARLRSLGAVITKDGNATSHGAA